jgi:hypothetical protein
VKDDPLDLSTIISMSTNTAATFEERAETPPLEEEPDSETAETSKKRNACSPHPSHPSLSPKLT